jgi:hypothetical protein
MSADVVATVAELGAQELRDIAGRHGGEIGPRWRNSPEWVRGALPVAAAVRRSNAMRQSTSCGISPIFAKSLSGFASLVHRIV